MRKIIYLGFLGLLSGTAFGQNLDPDECKDLKEIVAQLGKAHAFDDWSYNSGADLFEDCDCTNTDFPSVSDIADWPGTSTTTISSVAYINRLDLNNRITDWHSAGVDLFGGGVFEELSELTMGNTGQTLPPTIDVGALPSLTQLYWYNESSMGAIPELAPTGTDPFPNLRSIRFSGWTDLNAYASSNVPEIKDRVGLTSIVLYNLDFDLSQNAPFDNIYAGSKATLIVFSTKDVYDPAFSTSGKMQWLPDDFLDDAPSSTEAFPSLSTFIYGEPSSSLTDYFLEPDLDNNNGLEDVGAVFNDNNFPSLTQFNVSNSGFKGSVPSGLFTAPGMRNIYIPYNTLTGSVIPDLSAQTDIQIYQAQSNDFSATEISDLNEFEWMEDLITLRIDGCQLHCPLSAMDLHNSEDLAYFNVNANAFSGPIPEYYGDFPLTSFNAQSNYLTYCPTLTSSTISYLNIAENYLGLDDIYRAVNASACGLMVLEDGGNDNVLQISSQRDQAFFGTRTVNISAEDVDHGTYGQTSNVYDAATENLAGRNSGVLLDIGDAVDLAGGPNSVTPSTSIFDCTWVVDATGTVNDGPADGDNDNPVYYWAETDNSAGLSGATWYCEVHLAEPTTCGVSVDGSGFYAELSIETGHTAVTFAHTEDECSLGVASSVPYQGGSNEEGHSTNNQSELIGLTSEVSVSSDRVKVNIYPNPAANNFTIESSEAVELIRVFDLHGRMVSEGAVNGTTVNYSLSNLEDGTYFVQFKTASGWSKTKIAKTH